jgi:hypothetical protein
LISCSPEDVDRHGSDPVAEGSGGDAGVQDKPGNEAPAELVAEVCEALGVSG